MTETNDNNELPFFRNSLIDRKKKVKPDIKSNFFLNNKRQDNNAEEEDGESNQYNNSIFKQKIKVKFQSTNYLMPNTDDQEPTYNPPDPNNRYGGAIKLKSANFMKQSLLETEMTRPDPVECNNIQEDPFSTGLVELKKSNQKRLNKGLYQNFKDRYNFTKPIENRQNYDNDGSSDDKEQKRVLNMFNHEKEETTQNNGVLMAAHKGLFRRDFKANTTVSKNRTFKPPVKAEKNQPQPPKTDLQIFAEEEGLDMNLVEQIEHEIIVNKPMTLWSDIAGLQYIKKVINETIIYPMQRPDIFKGLRSPAKGILLFGPPGTGKTMIGKAIAGQLKSTFFSISSSSLVSKWIGESEKLIKTLFKIAIFMQPSVIFIDEIDSLLSVRGEGEMDAVRRIKTEFFVQLDGTRSTETDQLLVIGTTNRPEYLDEAARRRFVKRLYVPLPCESARRELINALIEKERQLNFQFNINEEEVEEVVRLTKGYSCADITNLLKECAMFPVRDLMLMYGEKEADRWDLNHMRAVNMIDFRESMRFVKSSVGIDEIERYKVWNIQYGSYEFTEET